MVTVDKAIRVISCLGCCLFKSEIHDAGAFIYRNILAYSW